MALAAHRGFTLVELMVALTIASILIVLAVPQYTTWMANSQIRAGAESVASGLRQAQLAAISQNRNSQFTLAANGWNVEMVGPPLTLVQTASLAEGSKHATFSGIDSTGTASSTLQFNALGQVIPNATSVVQIDVTNPLASAKPLRVLVGNGRTGVKVCDPSIVVASDPKYCPP
ncbi:MAG TPA: GspH/FimT family pseudopilin [Casimicrobiaceae bacterium]|nr:GspH/FimT family pseudopilin [Casimicrobiaceae bacterium]